MRFRTPPPARHSAGPSLVYISKFRLNLNLCEPVFPACPRPRLTQLVSPSWSLSVHCRPPESAVSERHLIPPTVHYGEDRGARAGPSSCGLGCAFQEPPGLRGRRRVARRARRTLAAPRLPPHQAALRVSGPAGRAHANPSAAKAEPAFPRRLPPALCDRDHALCDAPGVPPPPDIAQPISTPSSLSSGPAPSECSGPLPRGDWFAVRSPANPVAFRRLSGQDRRAGWHRG